MTPPPDHATMPLAQVQRILECDRKVLRPPTLTRLEIDETLSRAFRDADELNARIAKCFGESPDDWTLALGGHQ